MNKSILLVIIFLYTFKIAAQNFESELYNYQKTDSLFTHSSIISEDIHSLIVFQQGSIVFEKYYNSFHPDSLNNLKSITKSIVSLLVGIALEKGIIASVDEPITKYFDECENTQFFKEKAQITIRNLLLMNTGIEWRNYGEIKRQWWYHQLPHCYLLSEAKMDTIPGAKFSYNSAVAHLLSGIISRTSKQNTYDFAMENLFRPLGITEVLWGVDSNREFLG